VPSQATAMNGFPFNVQMKPFLWHSIMSRETEKLSHSIVKYHNYQDSHIVTTMNVNGNTTGLLKMTVRVLTTCHTQYTSDSSM